MIRRPAVIFDRDGTLFSVAHHMGEIVDHMSNLAHGPLDWHDFNASVRFDAPVPVVFGLWRAIRPGVDRIIVSGRDGAFAPAMRDSFSKHGIVPDAFFHRPINDRRRDSAVKEQILDELILPRWDVLFVVDDRIQVVEMWRSRNVPVLHVTDPGVMPTIGE